MTLIGEIENSLARFEEATLILREAPAMQREMKSLDRHYMEDSLCPALRNIGQS